SGAVPSLLGSCSGRVPNRVLLPGGEEGVGDLGDLRHRADAVDADDMGTGQDAGGDGGGGAPLALVGWNVTECQRQEGLARGTEQDRTIEPGKDGVVEPRDEAEAVLG